MQISYFGVFELLLLLLLPCFGLFLTGPKPHLTFTSHHVHTGSCLVESSSPCWRPLEAAPIQTSKQGVVQAQCSPWTTTINICPIHIPSLKNLELVPLFLLPLDQPDYFAFTFPLSPTTSLHPSPFTLLLPSYLFPPATSPHL